MAAVSGYDGFISYSHKHDAVLGPALQTNLERFAKPWYKIRALRIFLDTADLSANPALWPSIEDGLSSSQWFILLASADAACCNARTVCARSRLISARKFCCARLPAAVVRFTSIAWFVVTNA